MWDFRVAQSQKYVTVFNFASANKLEKVEKAGRCGPASYFQAACKWPRVFFESCRKFEKVKKLDVSTCKSCLKVANIKRHFCKLPKVEKVEK
jgi:hypothetical protein